MTGEHSVRELLLLAQNHIPPSQTALRGAIEGWLASHPMDEHDALRTRVAKLEEALKKFKTDMCEGWCDEADHIFSDCQGCEARAALAAAGQPQGSGK
jgi:hypothetical protein